MKTSGSPLPVLRGDGAYLELKDGRRIVDCISSWWVTLHGHGQKEIADAIHEQAMALEHVIFAGFTHEPALKLAKSLQQLLYDCLNEQADSRTGPGAAARFACADPVPANHQQFIPSRAGESSTRLFDSKQEPLTRMFFSDNGSTAVEVSVKMALQYWYNKGQKQRKKFVGFQNGYHGDTVGAMSAGGSSVFWDSYRPLMFPISFIDYPSTWENDERQQEKEQSALQSLTDLFQKEADTFAALIIEPLVQGAAGMHMCSPQFLSDLKEVCQRFGVLLIFDEVMTGFGRTGDFFATTKSQVVPDILCVSKGITGGFLPLSGTLCTEKIYEAFLDDKLEKAFFHSHSYTGNPIACAAANASLKLLQENAGVFRGMEMKHRQFASRYLSPIPNLKNLRFCGTIMAFELELAESSHYFNSVAPTLRQKFLDNGLLLRPLGNTIYLMPPYCISEEQMDFVYATINKVVSDFR